METINKKLSEAAGGGSELVLKGLLCEPGCDALAKCKDGRTALVWAAYYGHEDCIKPLLPKSDAWACTRILVSLMDLPVHPKLGTDAILHSASKGSSTAALWLLNLYPCLTTPSCAFLAACQSQDPESLGNFAKSLSSFSPSEKAELASRGLLIYCAVPFVGFYGSDNWMLNRLRSDDELCTRTLLALGANPLTRDPQGLTPLAHAVVQGHPGAASLLLGLTRGALAPGRRSAARMARENNHLAMAEELAVLQRTSRVAATLERVCLPACIPHMRARPRL